ncbi:MAG: hypothetical protein JST54_34645 [Deltaproteobacteria bacterium]|nr:hypothetical protein [Deltaproteobacteria bacterium]
MLTSIEQLDKFGEDFVVFYNRDRPHSAYGGRTSRRTSSAHWAV